MKKKHYLVLLLVSYRLAHSHTLSVPALCVIQWLHLVQYNMTRQTLQHLLICILTAADI